MKLDNFVFNRVNGSRIIQAIDFDFASITIHCAGFNVPYSPFDFFFRSIRILECGADTQYKSDISSVGSMLIELFSSLDQNYVNNSKSIRERIGLAERNLSGTFTEQEYHEVINTQCEKREQMGGQFRHKFSKIYKVIDDSSVEWTKYYGKIIGQASRHSRNFSYDVEKGKSSDSVIGVMTESQELVLAKLVGDILIRMIAPYAKNRPKPTFALDRFKCLKKMEQNDLVSSLLNLESSVREQEVEKICARINLEPLLKI